MRLIFRTFVPFAGGYRVTNLLNHVEQNFRFERASGYKRLYLAPKAIFITLC